MEGTVVEKLLEAVLGAMTVAFYLAGIALYFFGMYVVIADDHRYTSKDVVIAGIFFPYAWFTGVKQSTDT